MVIEIIFDVANFRHLKKKAGIIPDEFKDVIDSEKLLKHDLYNSEKMKFELFSGVISNIISLFFLFSPLFPFYVELINNIPVPFILKGIFFFLILIIISDISALPFSFYFHFKIEEKYGFNKYTVNTFLIDKVKSMIISSLILTIILCIILTLSGNSVQFKWIYVFTGWGALAIFSLILTYLVPILILPFFYKLKPLPDGELKNSLNNLIQKCGVKIKGLYSADESKRSTHANAAVAGIGKSKKIIIFDTMLNEKYSSVEILAVIAHEIGHAKKKHILKQTVISMAVMFVAVAFVVYALSSNYIYTSMNIPHVFYAGLLVISIFFSNITFFWSPLFGRLSRKFEYEADAYSSEALCTPEPLISSFKKMVSNDLSNINPHPFYEEFFYSHPSAIKRIKRLRENTR